MNPAVDVATSKPAIWPYATGICAGLFAFAFVAAPYSCEWGLNAYFVLGLVAMIALFFVPVGLWHEAAVAKRILLGLGLAAFGLATWLAGIFAANMQLLCRLF
jgi:hypothetical protein